MPYVSRSPALDALVAGVVGVVLPFYWSSVGMLLFNASGSAATRALDMAMIVTCPFWAMPGLYKGELLMTPVLNAGLYLLVRHVAKAALGRRRGASAIFLEAAGQRWLPGGWVWIPSVALGFVLAAGPTMGERPQSSVDMGTFILGAVLTLCVFLLWCLLWLFVTSCRASVNE